MKKWRVGVGLTLGLLFVLDPRATGGAVGLMALWFPLVYLGWRGTAKAPPLPAPFLAFGVACCAMAVYLSAGGVPDTSTAWGQALYVGVPFALAAGTVKFFYRVAQPRS